MLLEQPNGCANLKKKKKKKNMGWGGGGWGGGCFFDSPQLFLPYI